MSLEKNFFLLRESNRVYEESGFWFGFWRMNDIVIGRRYKSWENVFYVDGVICINVCIYIKVYGVFLEFELVIVFG